MVGPSQVLPQSSAMGGGALVELTSGDGEGGEVLESLLAQDSNQRVGWGGVALPPPKKKADNKGTGLAILGGRISPENVMGLHSWGLQLVYVCDCYKEEK